MEYNIICVVGYQTPAEDRIEIMKKHGFNNIEPFKLGYGDNKTPLNIYEDELILEAKSMINQ